MSVLGKAVTGNPSPFWHNGPAPGAFYNFPGVTTQNNSGIQRTRTPVTTGTTVLGIHFKDGVVIAADTLASYGHLARYKNVERLMKVNDNILLGSSGDYADYQYIKSAIEQKVLDEECLDDGFMMKPRSLHCWLTHVMYSKRSKLDPLWNEFLIAGFDDGKPFLGSVDKLGTAFTNPVIATGFGAYVATPYLSKVYEDNPELNEQQALEAVHKAMEILFYRDSRSLPKYHVGIITKEKGIEMKGPIELDSYWEPALIGHNKHK